KNKFRCLVNGVPSRVYTLSFVNVWTGHLDSSWENPNNWSCGAVPDADTEVVIAAGTVIINSNVSVGSLIVGSNAVVNVNTGYTLTITH
ncbi:MAG TPA: hypothetical protein VGB71_15160, partial [Flavisolibacter sp.]